MYIPGHGNPRRVVVMGLAKSGTTAIAQTIANTLGIERVIFEPKSSQEILDRASGSDTWVMKIIFTHVRDELTFLYEHLQAGGPLGVTDTIHIVRDTRGKLVSSIYYQAYEVFYYNDYGLDEKEAWLEVLRKKERRPNDLSMLWVSNQLAKRFGKKVFARRDVPQEQFHAYMSGVTAPHKLLRYEDFVAGAVPDPELAAMLQGRRSVPAEYKRVRRTEGDETWPNFLLDEDVEAINLHCGAMLEHYGYPLRLPPIENRVIDPRVGSDYVARLIDEAIADREAMVERGERPVPPKPYAAAKSPADGPKEHDSPSSGHMASGQSMPVDVNAEPAAGPGLFSRLRHAAARLGR